MILLQAMSSLWEVPGRITPDQWDQLRMAMVWLWAFTGSMIIVAGSVLVGHGLIPSLASSRDIPERYMSFRPILFGVAGLFLILGIFAFVSFLMELQVAYDIYPRVWI